jgi:molybdopterin/thiamine biosynthesis adenylyltransferase
MSIFFHEQLHRTHGLMAQLKDFPVSVCGAGALGVNIMENFARSGAGSLVVIDRDRIELFRLELKLRRDKSRGDILMYV